MLYDTPTVARWLAEHTDSRRNANYATQQLLHFNDAPSRTHAQTHTALETIRSHIPLSLPHHSHSFGLNLVTHRRTAESASSA